MGTLNQDQAREALKMATKYEGTVYLVRSEDGAYKIGHTRQTFKARFSMLRSANPRRLSKIHTFKAINSLEAEQSLHSAFGKKRIRGEWFNLDQDDLALYYDYVAMFERQYREITEYYKGFINT
jgi:hypothetical protein